MNTLEPMNRTMTREQTEKLLVEIRNISRGDPYEPLGFEAVAMAIAGGGLPGESSVTQTPIGVSENPAQSEFPEIPSYLPPIYP